jgi:AcrR family transcriptional regulator
MEVETRERLVEVARTLFWEQGYSATGIAQILKKAAAGSGSLYYFFPTKEHLLLAVLDWYLDNLGPMVVEPVLARVSDPIERIFGILDGYRRQLLATNFAHGCPVGSLALELSNSHPSARAKIAASFRQWQDVVRRCLDDAAGRLPAEVDRAALAQFVLTVMEGAVMLSRSYRSLDAFDAAVHSLCDYFERLERDGTDWTRSHRANPLKPPPTAKTRKASRRGTQ